MALSAMMSKKNNLIVSILELILKLNFGNIFPIYLNLFICILVSKIMMKNFKRSLTNCKLLNRIDLDLSLKIYTRDKRNYL